MTIKSPGERFCYICDAITPSECKCRRNAYCPKCKTMYHPPETCKCSHFVRERPTDIVGMIDKALDENKSAAVRRNEEENRRIWNSAIECAYHIAIKASESPEGIKVAEEVRKLKK